MHEKIRKFKVALHGQRIRSKSARTILVAFALINKWKSFRNWNVCADMEYLTKTSLDGGNIQIQKLFYNKLLQLICQLDDYDENNNLFGYNSLIF